MTLKSVGKNLIDAGQILATPAEWSTESVIRAFSTTLEPGRVDNCDSKTCEVFRRCVTVPVHLAFSPVTVGLMASGKLVMEIGDYLTGEDFYYIRGDAEEKKPDGSFSFLHMNVSMFFGGLPRAFDGLAPARERRAALVKLINKTQPDFLFLNEVSFGPGKKLVAELKGTYAHFYTRIGPPQFTKMETSLFLASKYPIESVNYTSLSDQEGINRGMLLVETEEAYFIATHLPSKEDFGPLRSTMLERIHQEIESLPEKKPVFLVGDLNVVRDQEYNALDLASDYWDPRENGRRPSIINSETATCTNRHRAYASGTEAELAPEDEWECDDYILRATFIEDGKPRVASMEVERVLGFKPGKEPLSDHHGLLATIQL